MTKKEKCKEGGVGSDSVEFARELARLGWTTTVAMGVLRWRDRASTDHTSAPGAGECRKLQETQVSRASSSSQQHEARLEG